MIESLAISLIASSTVLGIFVFFVKRYLDKLISYEFEKRNKKLIREYEDSKKTSGFILDAQLGMYPEITEISYRIRNLLLHGITQSHAYMWDNSLPQLCAHLTENLYKYQLFLSDDEFQRLHELKHIAQDALVLVDTYTRKENISDNTEYRKKLKEFESKAYRAKELHSSILKGIKARVGAMGGIGEL